MTAKQDQLDKLLRKALAEKYGLTPIVEDMENVKSVVDGISTKLGTIQDTIKGDKGDTPVKGKDYFTEDEVNSFLDEVTPRKGEHYTDGADGVDGRTPVKGVDYLTDGELEQIKQQAKPVKGTDYFTEDDVANFKKEVTPIKGKDYKDGENPTAAQFIEVIKNLKGPDAASFSQTVGGLIDISHVRNAGAFIFNGKKYKTEELMHGGGSGGSGGGTVTSVSVVSANGLAGTVATATTTPAITLSTTVTGVLKGNGTAISAAVANTDYQSPITLTTVGSSGAATFNGTTLNIPNYTGGSSGVASVVGTTNRITVNSTDPANPVVDIAATYVGQTSITTLGTISTGTWSGTTVAVAHGGTGVTTIAAKSIWLANSLDTITSVTPGAGQSIRINAGNTAWEAYTPAAGTVTSVSGTANRISSTGGATPVIDIDAAYVGQSSITTLGTIATGTWAGTTIAVNHGGTGGTVASITLFNNITGLSAAGTTGTTSTNLVFSTSPTLVTPTLGVATATSINKMAITAPLTSSTLAVADGKTFTASNTLTLTGTDGSSVAFGAGGTVLYTTSTIPLTVGTTTITSGTNTRILYNNSGVLGEYTITGSGTVVAMQTSPAFTTPSLGVATATSVNGLTISTTTGTLTMTNAKTLAVTNTLTLSGTDSTVMTFPTTTATIARTDAGQTFTGTQIMTSPKILTSVNDTNGNKSLGFSTAASAVNYINISNAATTFPPFIQSLGSDTNIHLQVLPKGTGTFQILDGADSSKGLVILTAGGTTATGTQLVVSQTANRNVTLPDATTTLAGLSVTQTFTATQTVSLLNTTPQTLTVTSNAATADINHGIQNFTNSSAATMTITLTTTSAVDGQFKEVRIFDFSAAAQTITWVNTENSTVTAPTTSNGSTTLPLSVLFQYNTATSKWRCLASS